MDGFFSDQSPMSTSHDAVVNYRSSSYGGFLFRSPNSPPPSPSTSIASDLSHLFFSAHTRRFPGPSPASSLQLRQPPLLPLPRSATLPATNQRIVAAASPPMVFRSRRQHAKRKGKAAAGARNDDPVKEISRLPPMKMKDEGKLAMAKGGKKSAEGKTIEEEQKMLVESVYSLSPSPSSLPLPRFSLTRPRKAGGGVVGRVVVVSCIAEAVAVAGGVDAGATDELLRI